MQKPYREYPFEDFVKHYRDLYETYELERRVFGESGSGGRRDMAFEENVIRIFDYMRTRYEPQEDAMEKSMLFGLIMMRDSQSLWLFITLWINTSSLYTELLNT